MRNLHLGTIGWSYNFWKGSFYPQKTALGKFLAFYATQFDTVEVDNTFYRVPTQQTIVNWKNQVGDDFKFSLKFPNKITHIKMLKDCQTETSFFLAKVRLLGEKLGPLLLQFPPNFGVDRMPDLEAYLHSLPKSNRYVVEVRDEAWLKPDFYKLLQANSSSLAWIDSPNMPLSSEVTTDFLYIRWEGDRKKVKGTLGRIEADTQPCLKQWADKLKPFLNNHTEVYGYFGKYYSGYPPSDISLLSKLIT